MQKRIIKSNIPWFPGCILTDRQKVKQTVSPAIPQYKIPIPLIVTDVSLISSEMRAIRNLQYSRGSVEILPGLSGAVAGLEINFEPCSKLFVMPSFEFA
jgi:hypothetical protein